MIPHHRHRAARPQRDRAYDVVVIVVSSVLMIIAVWMEILDRKERSGAAQVDPVPRPAVDMVAEHGPLHTD